MTPEWKHVKVTWSDHGWNIIKLRDVPARAELMPIHARRAADIVGLSSCTVYDLDTSKGYRVYPNSTRLLKPDGRLA